jgi:putative endonuclease
MAYHNEIGRIGEDIAAQWLSGRGHTIVTRNYRKSFGEIDIVTRETDGTVHFVEVKTVSYEARTDLDYAVSHETWRPEEMVHHTKQKKLANTIDSWLLKHSDTKDFYVDVVTVRVVPRERYAQIRMIPNVILER